MKKPTRSTAIVGYYAIIAANIELCNAFGIQSQNPPSVVNEKIIFVDSASYFPKNDDEIKSPYLIEIRKIITGNWNRLAKEGRALISFRLNNNGQIESIKIKESSGDNSFDQVAIMAVRRSNPLPKFPDSINEKSIIVNFWFTTPKQAIDPPRSPFPAPPLFPLSPPVPEKPSQTSSSTNRQ